MSFKKIISLFMIMLIIVLPVSFALEITHTPDEDVTDVTMNSALISWLTGLAADATINYGTSAESLDQSDTDSDMTTSHSFTLENLEAETTYYYALTSCASEEDCMTIDTESFDTLANDGQIGVIEIIDVTVVEVTQDTAMINWQTGVVSDSSVLYAESEQELEEEPEEQYNPNEVTNHTSILTELLSGTTYYFKVRSTAGDAVGESSTEEFTTELDEDDFLRLDEMPSVIAGNILYVSGISRPGQLRVYTNDIQSASASSQVTEQGFNVSVVLDSARVENNIIGYNRIRVAAWDNEGASDTEEFPVIVDTTPPTLNVNPLSDATGDQSLNISGMSEVGATIRVLVNGQESATAEINGTYFEVSVPVPSEGESNISVVAYDIAGNDNRQDFSVLIDRTPPTMEFDTDFSETTHMQIYKIKGTTEPGATVTVINIGDYESYESFVDARTGGESQRVSILFDPVGLVMGAERTATANSNGHFEVFVNLMMSIDNEYGENRLFITATDKAGNSYVSPVISVRFEPGCLDWIPGAIASYPFAIYLETWHAGSIEASAFIPLEYAGAGEPSNVNVEIRLDGTKGNNDLVQLGPTRSYFQADRTREDTYGTVYVSVPINIRTTNLNQEQLKEILTNCAPSDVTDAEIGGTGVKVGDVISGQCLDVYLTVDIAYNIGREAASCKNYPLVQFGVEFPLLLTKWLTPEQINDTIHDIIDPLINFTEKAAELSMQASMYTLAGCAAMILYNYASTLFGGGATSASGCAADPMTYWICDRVMCPSIPRSCGEFAKVAQTSKEFGKDEIVSYAAELESVNDNQYLTLIPVTDQSTFLDTYLGDDTDDRLRSDRLLLQNSFLYCQQEALRRGEDVTHMAHISRATRDSSGVTVSTVSSYDCVFTKNNKADRFDSNAADAESYFQDFLPGSCYKDDCPQYDQSKCMFAKGYGWAPSESLYSSAVCGCLPGLYGHFTNYNTILKGARQCLQQALIGEVQGGMCERLLAMFVCDLMIDVLKVTLFHDKGSGGVDLTPRLIDPVKAGQRKSEITTGLRDRYGGVLTEKLGLSTSELANKMCIGGITGDWSIIQESMTKFVKSIEIEPVISLMADSRPQGFDYFTGKMSIGYTATLGIIPGGDMEGVNLYLECDRGYEGGDMCGAQIDRRRIAAVPTRMQRGQIYNKNIFEQIDDSRWWYNKAVLEYKYRIGGEIKSEVMIKPIRKRGTLGFSCDFSLVGGISCQTPVMDEFGIVELLDEIKLSPKPDRYYSGNVVNLLVPMFNDYTRPFYLRVTVEGEGAQTRSIEYMIPAKQYANQMVTYNLPVFTVPSTGGGKTGSGITARLEGDYEDIQGLLFEIRAGQSQQEAAPVEIRVYQTADDAEPLRYSLKPTYRDASDAEKFGFCKLAVADENAPYKVGWGDYSKTGVGSDDDENDVVNRADLEKWIEDNIPTNPVEDPPVQDDFAGYVGNNVLTSVRTGYIPCFILQNKHLIAGKGIRIFAIEVIGDFLQSANVRLLRPNNPPIIDKGIRPSTTTTSSNVGTRSIKIEVYKDTGGNAHDGEGDTPIIYDAAPQEILRGFTIAGQPATGNTRPLVEIVEPAGDYVPTQDGWVPIGMNMLDDKNEIDRIQVGIFQGRVQNSNVDMDGALCAIDIRKKEGSSVFNPHNFEKTTGTKETLGIVDGQNKCALDFTPTEGELNFKNAPFQFFSFKLSGFANNQDMPDTEEYSVAVKAFTGKRTESTLGALTREKSFDVKTFSFDERSDGLAVGDVMVCQGGAPQGASVSSDMPPGCKNFGPPINERLGSPSGEEGDVAE